MLCLQGRFASAGDKVEGSVGHLHWMKMTPLALFVSSFVALVQPHHHVSFSLHSNVPHTPEHSLRCARGSQVSSASLYLCQRTKY